MTVDPATLITPVTEEEALNALLAALRDFDYDVTSWQTGSVQLTLLRAFAKLAAGLSGFAASVVRGLLLGYSTDQWLDLIGRFYKTPRLRQGAAVLRVRYTVAASASPQTIAVGDLLLVGTQTYVVTSGFGAIVASDTGILEVTAIVPGAAGNASLTASPVRWVTPHAGVALTLEAGDPPDDATPIITPGVAQEGDDRYTTRLALRWSQLTYAVGARAYDLWALTAAPSVTRTRTIPNYPTPNVVRVVLANVDGAATGAEIAQVEAYIHDGRRAINDELSVVAAAEQSIAFTLAPRVRTGGATSAQIDAAIRATLAALPIGGIKKAGGTAGYLLRDTIVLAVGALPGVLTVGLTSPAADTLLGGTDIVVPSSIDIAIEQVLS